MTKKEPNKSRIWERQRRSRLKTCFQELCRVLPSYDPCIILSKLEILQRATVYIEELQTQNKELINNGLSAESQEKSQIKVLEERMKVLLSRTEQLASLLNDAGIKVPSEYGNTLPQPVRRWSNKITKQQAEEFLAKKTLDETSKSKATSKIKKSSNNSSKIPVPALKTKSPQKISVKKTKKFVRIVSENKLIKKKKFKQQKNNLPLFTHLLNSSNIAKPVIVTQSNNTFTVLPNRNVLTLPVSQSLCINTNNNNKMTVSVPQSSIVLANPGVNNKNAITNPQLLPAPIMATSMTQTNLPISNFSAGTFILANGSILLPPAQTIIQPQPTILTAVLGSSQEPNQTVVLVQNPKQKDKVFSPEPTTNLVKTTALENNITKSVTSDVNTKPQRCLQKIVPKLGITKTTTVNKVPILALSSKFSASHTAKIVQKKTDTPKKIEYKNKNKENIKLDSEKKESKNVSKTIPKQNTASTLKCSAEKTEDNSDDKNSMKNNDIPSTSKESEKSTCISDCVSKTDTSKVIADSPMLKRKNKSEESNEMKKNKNLELPCKESYLNPTKSDTSNHKVPSSDYSIDSLCKNNTKDVISNNETKFSNMQPTENSNNILEETKTETKVDKVTASLDKDQKREDIKSTAIDEKLIFEDNSMHQSKVSILNKVESVSVDNEKIVDEIKSAVPVTTSVATNSDSLRPPETLGLSLPHSELSNDIFASLQVPTGGQNPESISPTAAFLLSFPLVSTLTGGKISEVVEDENSDSPHGTPTLLQIGNIDSSKVSQTDLTPNLLTLDNFSSFFTHKEYYNGSFSTNDTNGTIGTTQRNTMSLSPTKSLSETRPSENKFIDFDHSDPTQTNNNIVKPKDTKYLNANDNSQMTKKSHGDDLHITNSNCLYSNVRLHSGTTGNIFNYEHVPVTHPNVRVNMPESSNSTENKAISSHCNITKTKLNMKNKNSEEQSCESIIFTPPNPSKSVSSISVSHNSNSNTMSQNSHVTTVSKIKSTQQNQVTKETLRPETAIHNTSCMQNSGKQTLHHTDYSEPCQTFNNQFSIPDVKNLPVSISNGNSIQSFYDIHNSKQRDVNDTGNLVENKFENNVKVKTKTDYVSSYQNIFNNEFTMPTFTYPDSKTQDKQIVSSTYYGDNNLTSTYKNPKIQPDNKQFQKPHNIPIYSQKPPVNWMTAPSNTKHQMNTDYIFQPFGKDTDYSQNAYFPTNNFTSSTQPSSFFSSCNNLYQNMENNNHNNEPKKLSLPHNNFSRSDNIPSEDNQFSWSPSKLPTFIDNTHNNLVLPSTLPTLMGDLALNTHNRTDTKPYSIETEQVKNINDPQKEIFSHKEIKYKNKNHLNDQQQNSGNTNFLSVSQLVEHNKNDSTSQRSQINIKKVNSNKNNKNNSIQKQNKRTSKSSETTENHSITSSHLPTESYNSEKNIQDQHNKSRSQYLPSKLIDSFENSTNNTINTNQPSIWLQESNDKLSNRNNYKNSSSNYSAEALIGHNAISEHCSHSVNKNNPRYSQHYSQTTKASLTNNPFVSDSIVSSFYPSVELHTSQNTPQYYSQAHNNSLTYTTSGSMYQPSNFISNTPSIMSNYVSSGSLVTELDNEYQTQPFSTNSTSHIKNIPSKSSSYNRSYAPVSLSKFEQRSHTNYIQSNDRKSNIQSCSVNHTKRTTTKRKHSSLDTNITGFVDLGFLPMSATINSPMSTEDPFHNHSSYLPTNSSQLYPTNNQNSLYPKPYNQTNHEFSSSHASSLLPLSTLPVNKNNMAISQPEQSPNSNTTGTTLTNFNLSTIFPEINKPGTISVPGIYTESHRTSNILPATAALHSSVNYSNLLSHTTAQVGLNNKTTYLPLNNIGNASSTALQFPNTH